MAHANDHDKLIHVLEKLNSTLIEIERHNVIAQSTLDASLAGLTAAVASAAAALATSSTATSTPDAAVAAYQAGVDAQTVALATATPAPVVTAAK